MKFVKLLTAAYVGGVLRHPHEGVLHVSDDDAARLIENEAAEDVTEDFSAAQLKELPKEVVAATPAEATITSEPHQSEVAPATTTAPKARKAAASKE